MLSETAFPSFHSSLILGFTQQTKRHVLILKEWAKNIIQHHLIVCALPGYAGSCPGVCLLFLPIVGFPATYLRRLWLECWGWATVPKLISASSPPHLSSWLWAGFPYALQDIKVHSQQEDPSKKKRTFICFAGVLPSCKKFRSWGS